MIHTVARIALWACVVAQIMACAGPDGPRDAGSASQPAAPSTPKRLVASIQADPRAFNDKVARATAGGAIRGGPELEGLLNAGLTVVDDRGALVGQLAEAAPSQGNAMWQLFPDGRMRTTWTIRRGGQWHDGTPFSASDLLFTANVVRDPELGVAFRESALEWIESVEAPDDRTVVVHWTGPLIDADRLFSQRLAIPLPRHILEAPLNEDKSRLLTHPYWLSEFVGTGPFKIRNWVQGSHLVLQAHDGYALGRPRVDEVEVRFIIDPNAVISNLLAGVVELTLGYGLSLEAALELRRQWSEGRVEIAPNGWIPIHPQFLNPRPAIVADRRFREALMMALDRQEMADMLQAGQVTVAHAFLNPAEPEYAAVENSIVRYEYNPTRAAQALGELGYTRGSDGWLADAGGQRLGVEIGATEGLEIQVKGMFAVADYWQRVGVEVRSTVRSSPANLDREETASFASFRVSRQPTSVDDMRRYLISQAPVAENRFTGFNFARYINPEFNAMIERFFVTIALTERIEVLRQILGHQTYQLSQMGLFYNVQSTAIGKRAQNVTNSGVAAFNQAWNAQLWELR